MPLQEILDIINEECKKREKIWLEAETVYTQARMHEANEIKSLIHVAMKEQHARNNKT